MQFTIQIDTDSGSYKMEVERTYAGESIEKFRVSAGNRSMELQSNRPLLLATKSVKPIVWKILEGEFRNPDTKEATVALFRTMQAIEGYLAKVERDHAAYLNKAQAIK